MQVCFYTFLFQDAIEALCFTFHSSNMDLFVETVINWTLEHSETARKKVGPFLAQLVKQKILLKSQYEKGLQNVLQFAGDLVVDIPKIWDYLGQLIGKYYPIRPRKTRKFLLRLNKTILTIIFAIKKLK